ncbi:MAG: methylated-DNA--[protein]-cysteine S-methyltransferase [Deltaproteobacteria bacterium]|nr:methylated-DNA--[protein]-cysteine S-methyltransferase [Deltaproteobacteria bacterium]
MMESTKSNQALEYASYPAPWGDIWIARLNEKICYVSLKSKKPLLDWAKKNKFSLTVKKPDSNLQKQLKEYFLGKRQHFDYPCLFLTGTAFQQKVWKALQKIPYGRCISYKELAQKIHHPSATRAVGNANGKNCLPLFIPCHRVIESNGGLGGFSCGLPIKKILLKTEGFEKI